MRENRFHLSIIIRMLVSAAIVFPATDAHAAWWPFGDKSLDYAIVVQGVDARTQEWLDTLELTQKTKHNPPKSLDDLEQEGISLEQRLTLALKARGYYQAQIDMTLERAATPPVLHYAVFPGPQVHVSDVTIEWEGGELPDTDLHSLELQPGEAVDAEAITKDAVALRDQLGKDRCLLSLTVKPVLRLDVQRHEAMLVYRIAHGPSANFGPVHISGNSRTREEAIKQLLTWKQGECFTQSKIEDSQSALFGSQLFSSVEIQAMPVVDAQGQVPVNITLKERSPRTVRAGANYATDNGFGVNFGWEHRNFSGGAEKVNADAVLSQLEQSLSLTERIPGFLRNDQILNLTGGITHEDTDAYTSDSLILGAGIERRISGRLNLGAGVGYDLRRTDDARNGEETYSLLSLPLFAEMDTRDNATDARKGYFARAAITPYQDMIDSGLHFLKTTATVQTYLSSDGFWKPTLALRGSVGSIPGTSYNSLPSDLRYYAGGGGSVRGYSYQSLSPRFNGEPIGGGSLIELSSELRLRFTETMGGVMFLDAGNAYLKSIPNPSDGLYYGAGVGIRYYSAIGPIRFDVGVPLNGDEKEDSAFQIYVSLGQAF